MPSLKVDKRGKLALSEAQVQRACIEMLRSEGWIVRPAPRDGRKAARGAFSVPAGEPDLIAVKWVRRGLRDGGWRVLFLECKSATGRLSPVQRAWSEDHEAWTIVVRSVSDLKALLEGTRAA